MTSFLQTQAAQLLNFLADQNINLINFTVLEAGNLKGGPRPRQRAEVEKCLSWAAARNARGAAVYWRPARRLEDEAPAAWPVVFLDDLTPIIAAAISKKYRCAVIETSFENFQAWIITSRQLNEEQRHQVQAVLASLVDADAGSVSGEHFGRFPGFRNMKPGRGGFRIELKALNTTAPPLDPTPYLSNASQGAPAPSSPPKGGRVPLMLAPRTADSGDESAKEFRFAVSRLRAGDSPVLIAERIAARALARGKRQTEAACTQYALRTVKKARVVTSR
jgi:hypothetical protein